MRASQIVTEGGAIEVGQVFKIKGRSGEYLCVDTKFEGGGTGHGPHDVYPNGWNVYFTKLNPDGTFNPNALVQSRYQSGCFTESAMMPKFTRIRKMRKIVQWENDNA